MDIRQIPAFARTKKKAEDEGGLGKKKRCVRRIHVISNILQDEMFEPPNACERTSRQRRQKRGEASTQTISTNRVRIRGDNNTCPDGRQFPPVVRPRFRGFRFPAVDCSAFAVVGEFVSPPFRFSCAFCIDGVDDPAGADAFGLGAFVCCGVPFALSGDDDGEDADGAPCGIVAGVI